MRVVVELHDLSRAAFDELRGDAAELPLARTWQWSAEITLGPRVSLELYTREPPADHVPVGLRVLSVADVARSQRWPFDQDVS